MYAFYRVYVWNIDVPLRQGLLARLIVIAHLRKTVSMAIASIPVITLRHVASTLSVRFTNITNSALAPKVSLVTLKLNVFACPTLVFPIKDVLVA